MNIKTAISNSIRIATLLFIAFSIVNLIIEIYATSEFKNTQSINTLVGKIEKRPDISSDFIIEHAKDQINGSNNIRFHYALGYVLDYTNTKTFKGTNNGRRITLVEYLRGKDVQGVLFGASMTWGYFAPDEKIISSVLSNKLKNTGIDNYSIQGKTLEQIKLYLKYEQEELKDKDFAIVVGGDLSPKFKTMTLMRFPINWSQWRSQNEKTLH